MEEIFILGILVGLLIILILSYRGRSVIWVAPFAALAVALFGGLDLLPAYTDIYMSGFVGFVKQWFPVFMLGAIFGKLMEVTGMAESVGKAIIGLLGEKQAILATVLATALLTYGGISLFVVVFTVYPIARELFREANISKKLMPAAIILGGATFTMTAVPGSPAIQNLIPMEYFGTTPTAGAITGIIASIIIFVFGMWWLNRRAGKLLENGEGFIKETEDTNIDELSSEKNLPNPLISLIPLFGVIITLNILNWDVVVALLTGNILIMMLSIKHFRNFLSGIDEGARGSVGSIINTSAAVGFGTVVQATPAFATLVGLLLAVPGGVLVSEAITVNILAGTTASASGGLAIALEVLGETYANAAMAQGIPMEALHRVASIASGGIDALPHSGAVVTIITYCGMTHRESYGDVAWVAIVGPLIALTGVLILMSFGIY